MSPSVGAFCLPASRRLVTLSKAICSNSSIVAVGVVEGTAGRAPSKESRSLGIAGSLSPGGSGIAASGLGPAVIARSSAGALSGAGGKLAVEPAGGAARGSAGGFWICGYRSTRTTCEPSADMKSRS